MSGEYRLYSAQNLTPMEFLIQFFEGIDGIEYAEDGGEPYVRFHDFNVFAYPELPDYYVSRRVGTADTPIYMTFYGGKFGPNEIYLARREAILRWLARTECDAILTHNFENVILYRKAGELVFNYGASPDFWIDATPRMTSIIRGKYRVENLPGYL